MPETRQQSVSQTVEPYKISEIFSIVPDYDGNPIFLNTFLSSCTTAQAMCSDNQLVLLVLHIKNKLRGRAAELVNSRNPTTWDDIKDLLENHFGDSRDLSALIQDLQRMRQMPNESPLTFAARLQTHEAKMHSAVNKQNLTPKEKQAQITLIDSMALNTLLTGLEPKVGQIIRASDPDDIITAISRIKRELQLRHFETQKFTSVRNETPPTKKPIPSAFTKICSFCRRTGHTINECMIRQRQTQQSNSQSSPNFRVNPFSPQQNLPFRGNSNFDQNRFQPQNRPFSNGNSSGQHINKPNTNFPRPNTNFSRPNHQRTHHLNESSHYFEDQSDNNYYHQDTPDYQEYYPDEAFGYEETNSYPSQEEFNFNQPQYFTDNQNFHQNSCPTKPPDSQIDDIESRVQTMTVLDNFNPNVNFPEQNFL